MLDVMCEFWLSDANQDDGMGALAAHDLHGLAVVEEAARAHGVLDVARHGVPRVTDGDVLHLPQVPWRRLTLTNISMLYPLSAAPVFNPPSSVLLRWKKKKSSSLAAGLRGVLLVVDPGPLDSAHALPASTSPRCVLAARAPRLLATRFCETFQKDLEKSRRVQNAY